jgi:hypothetical protein
MAFCFEPQSKYGTITDLFKSINFFGFNMPYEIEIDLSTFLKEFKNNLEKEELTALYFWVLNQKYSFYVEDFKCEDGNSEKEFDREFGRSLAYKIYEPNNSGLEHDTFEELKLLLYDFTSEFDLSVIDECTSDQILEVIDLCCKSSKNQFSVL